MGEKAIKALLAADDRDLRSHSLKALLQELDQAHAQRWQRQARVLDKLYAPTRYPDALGDELPADVFGPEDGTSALQAAEELLDQPDCRRTPAAPRSCWCSAPAP